MAISLLSCEDFSGKCGIIKGGDMRDNGSLYFKVDFGDKTKNVTVDLNTFVSYNNGDYICFD